MPQLQKALGSITKSTWGIQAPLARQLYLGAIRPALSYGALAWYPLLEDRKQLTSTLANWQGKFLRSILGAYRAIATSALEIELNIEPLDLYIKRQATISLEQQAYKQKQELTKLEISIKDRYSSLRRRTTKGTKKASIPNYKKVTKRLRSEGI